MPSLDPAFAAHLREGATTVCRCWRLVRRDGTVLGFTDHDRDIAVAGTLFAARSGLDAAEAERVLGFAAPGADVSGALTSAGITDADIAAGLYDGATVETWAVVWSDPDTRALLDVATLGEIRRADGAFVAELRGLMHALDEERGRVYRTLCDADLGDARCGVDLGDPRWRFEGTVLASDGAAWLRAEGLGERADGLFTGGVLHLEGAAGLAVRAHAGDRLDLWAVSPLPITPGLAFSVTAGCARTFAACRDRFANALNFRGFPHMPGNDFVLRPVGPGEGPLDGRSLFR